MTQAKGATHEALCTNRWEMLPTTFAILLRAARFGGQEATADKAAVRMWKCCQYQFQLPMKEDER